MGTKVRTKLHSRSISNALPGLNPTRPHRRNAKQQVCTLHYHWHSFRLNNLQTLLSCIFTNSVKESAHKSGELSKFRDIDQSERSRYFMCTMVQPTRGGSDLPAGLSAFSGLNRRPCSQPTLGRAQFFERQPKALSATLCAASLCAPAPRGEMLDSGQRAVR